MFKIHNEAVPSVISGMFVKRFKIINRETRQSHNFNVPIVLSAHTKRTIYYNGPVPFNKFCTSLDSIHTFKVEDQV